MLQKLQYYNSPNRLGITVVCQDRKYSVKTGVQTNISEVTFTDSGIILDEVDKLKGEPVSKICDSLGLQLRWQLTTMEHKKAAEWILTYNIS